MKLMKIIIFKIFVHIQIFSINPKTAILSLTSIPALYPSKTVFIMAIDP